MSGNFKFEFAEAPSIAGWGAGAKSAALAARVSILSELGFEGSQLTFYERHSPASAWSGSGGYTDGSCQLGTSLGKGVVFPCDQQGLGGDAYRRLAFEQYSFESWRLRELVRNPDLHARHNTRINTDGVICANTAPHCEWARYLQDVYMRSGADVVTGEIVAAMPKNNRWRLTIEYPDGHTEEVGHDALMITGQGAPRRPLVDPEAEGAVFDGRDVYARLSQLKQICAESKAPILVYGSGESAGGAVLFAAKIAGPRDILWISTSGLPLERIENRDVNLLYSDPDSGPKPWSQRTRTERLQLIHSTDRGVVSPKVLRAIEAMPNVVNACGRVARVERIGSHTVRAVHEDGSTLEGTAVIAAIGFDAWSWVDTIVGDEFREELSEKHRPALEEGIRHDLSLNWSGPKLFVPMLAGVAQGPGMPNLSCLGRVAQRILDPFYERFETAGNSRPVYASAPHNLYQEAR